MKKHVRLSLLCVLITSFVTFLTSCEEEHASLIGTWKVTSAVFNPPIDSHGVEIVDAYPRLFDACNHDDLLIFEANGVFKEDGGTVRCDSVGAQVVTGTYSESGSTLTIVTDSSTTIFNNVEINDDELTGTVVFAFSPTIIAPVDFTLTRQ